ncbi:MAG: ABC transporter substrate-binding protein [Actinocatenispora sp.]
MRRVLWAVPLTLAGLLAAACSAPSDQNSADDGAADTARTAAVQLDAKATGPAPAVKGAQSGGTVSVLVHTPRKQFDPASAYVTDENEILKLTSRTLTVFTERDGRSVLVPDLATNLGEPSKDGLTWTFHLKPGLKYEDGSTIRAQDVAYAVKRSFAHDEYLNGPTYQDEYLKGGADYQGPYKSGDSLAGVSTPDNTTVVFHLVKPFPDLRYFASFPLFAPLPKAKDTKNNYGLHPFASGPYKFDSFSPATELKLVRNPHWDPRSDPARHQYPDGYDIKFNQDLVKVQTQIIASNGPDATALNYEAPDASVVPKLQTPQGKQRLVTGTEPCTSFMTLNTQKLPLAVRRAVAAAWPYESYDKAAGKTPLTHQPATTILPPSTPGYVKADVLGNGGKGDGDPNKAKSLLRKAGKVGFTLVWYYADNDPIDQKITAVMQDKLTAAGFRTKPIGVPAASVGSEASKVDGPANINQTPGGWCLDWPSAATMFPAIFDGRSIGKGYSVGFLNDKHVNAENDRLAAEPDPAKAAAGWAKLDRYILSKDLPVIPTGYSRSAFIVGNRLGNVVDDAVVGVPDFSLMYVKK